MSWEETVMKLKCIVKTKTMYPANQIAEAQMTYDQKQMEKQAQITRDIARDRFLEWLNKHGTIVQVELFKKEWKL